jgi:hypothetical protein
VTLDSIKENQTMTRSESITHLATALAKAQAEMPVAVFDATNPFLKSKYASLGAVIQSSRPILAKHKLSLVQFPISGGPNLGLANATGNGSTDCVGVESILTHESGEFVSERILILLTEEKGKSRVQSTGSTLTYLRRYSWASILGMYSDEDSDGCVPHGPLSRGDSVPGLKTFQTKPATALPPPPTQRN